MEKNTRVINTKCINGGLWSILHYVANWTNQEICLWKLSVAGAGIDPLVQNYALPIPLSRFILLSKMLQLSALEFALGLILSSALPIPFTFYFDDLKCFNFQRRTSRWDWSCDAAEREEEEQGGCHQGNWPRTKGEYIFNSFLQSVFIKSPWWVFWIVSGRFFCFYCFYMILMRQGCVYNWNR